ncbi:Asparaginase/glutaminase [Gemmatirosa kalamazoonensis]|uniref:Asparaginase/glutaminase n=1 Tax=Gemmatirosa kalamazoonensis TaxID=861299 RepID=W0RIX5_9BACT|nr:asparaginase [Gemmatirosa kalamazoonensis]AHG91054.1 Asparaginase/glutaminase [Gemmatirosa kalamazoonensis]
MRVIAALFTGGTISMRVDESAGGAVPSLSAEEILEAARGIERVARVRPEQWGRYPGPHMTVDRQWALRNRIAELLADPEIHGVVATHGTDTLEETAYLVARSVASRKPIVFTGAMRSASDLGWDGPANLLDAVTVAAAPEAEGIGTVVVMGGRVFAGLEDAKTHTHDLSAFESPGLGPLGVIDEGRVIVRRRLAGTAPVLCPEAPAEPVDIVTAWAGCDARLLDASRESGARGVVLAAMGRGNVPPAMVPGIERWIADGKPVVIASRAGEGRVGQTYAYPGGGRRLHELGAVFAGARRPQQARIDLMLALGAGLGAHELRAVFEG